jgi:tetratricopeptide (TPR) repeat protein
MAAQGQAEINRAELDARWQQAHEERIKRQTHRALEMLNKLLADTRGKPEFLDLKVKIEREMAEAYLTENNPATAVVYLNDVVEQQPSDGLSQYKLGMAYRDLGDNRRATTHLRAAAEGGFSNLAAQVNLIEAAFLAKQSALALNTAKALLEKPMKSVAVLVRIGNLLFEHLFYREALRYFQTACGLEPGAFEPCFRAALVSYLLDDNPAVVKALSGFVAVNAEAASLVASAEAKLGHYARAEEILRTTIEHFPGSQHAYINLALIEMDQGENTKAESLLDTLRAMNAKGEAKVFYTMKRNGCAEAARGASVEVAKEVQSPEKAEFYEQLAAQLQRGSNYLSAVGFILLAQMYGEHSAASLYVAAVSCLNHDPLSSEPVTLLREAIRSDPQFAQAYYLLGRASVRQGRLADAASAFRKATELDANPTFYVSLGKTLKSEGSGPQQRNQAKAAYEQALKIDPQDAQAHLELGRLFVESEKFEDARSELEKALELEPDFFEAAYLLGRLYHREGDEKKSRKHIEQFSETKKALMEQSVLGAGYLGEDR